MKPEKTTTPRKARIPRRNSESSELKPRRTGDSATDSPLSSNVPAEPAASTSPASQAVAGSQTAPVSGARKRQRFPAKPSPRKESLEVPPILLEGDAVAVSAVGGPGQRYALGPTPPPVHVVGAEEGGELPEAYGTKRLLLTARDPHWLYAHWDLGRDQLREYNRLSADRHLVLRLYLGTITGAPLAEVHVHPESRNWFVHVGRGGTRFVAQLGYYSKDDRKWRTISTSSPTVTPPDALSADISVQFATIPIDVPFAQLIELVKTAVREHVPLAEAILQLRAEGFKDLPTAEDIASKRWTAAQERALAQILSMDQVRRVWMGSLEITELIRRKIAREISSAAAAQFSLPTSPLGAVASVSSPYGRVERKKGFWFTINAEVIVYGATEPDATVSIGGRTIKLRTDGSFNYRFSLPDGQYELPILAVSADQTDGRRAEVQLSRRTAFRGEVGVHPQDPKLKPPRVGDLAP